MAGPGPLCVGPRGWALRAWAPAVGPVVGGEGVVMGPKGEGRNGGPKSVGPWLVRAGKVGLGHMGVN